METNTDDLELHGAKFEKAPGSRPWNLRLSRTGEHVCAECGRDGPYEHLHALLDALTNSLSMTNSVDR